MELDQITVGAQQSMDALLFIETNEIEGNVNRWRGELPQYRVAVNLYQQAQNRDIWRYHYDALILQSIDNG